MSITILPNSMRMVLEYLRGRSEITALVGQRVDVKSPPITKDPWIRISRVGGVPTSRFVDTVNLQVDCFTTPDHGELAAMDLARTAQAVLLEMRGWSNADGVVGMVETWEGLHNLPDTSRTPPTPRVMFGVIITVRP